MTRTTIRLTAGLAAAALAASGITVAAATSAAAVPATDHKDASGSAADPLPWTTNAARDRIGYRVSAYTGKFYDADYEGFRLCVVQREAGGNYGVVNWGGPWRGAYQFSSFWKYDIVDRLDGEMRRHYGRERWATVRDRLLSKEINQWNRFWQDAGFWAVFSAQGGWPWKGGNWYCDPRRDKETGRWPNRHYWNYLNGFEGPKIRYDEDSRARSVSSALAVPADRNDDRASRLGRSPYRFGTVAYSKWCARQWMRLKYGWQDRQWPSLNRMWWRESNWLFDERSTTGIYIGIPQTTAGVVRDYGFTVKAYKRDPLIQVIVGLRYIKGRYGTPIKAWNFWQRHGWY